MTVAARDRKVSGAVVDALGHSVPGAMVTVYRVVPPVRKSAKPTFATIKRTRTGELGRYTLQVPENLRPGPYRIVARLGESAVVRPLRLRVGG
jgi:protocatechuate 3,4-dioxygenase beta subunit